ncbi:MAG: DUF4440 domain-containing protein [Bacteroidota bacterium]
MVKSLFALLIVLALISCAPQELDTAALKGVIDEYNSLLTKSMLEGNMSATISYYADDAVSMPSSGPMLKGKEAIQNYSDEMGKSGVKFTAVKFTSSEVGGSGNLAYEIGTYEMSMEIGPAKVDDNGKYMTLWKKQADGSWKVFSEIWNSSVEAPH